ncbi:MAG: TrbC/VirB2 family protein [Sphingomonas sp.]|uniref:TrbC/VirB2 family protein n=1 Tax=Sphingomonas sp. TaxID=28214 RepID=UPI0035622C6D
MPKFELQAAYPIGLNLVSWRSFGVTSYYEVGMIASMILAQEPSAIVAGVMWVRDALLGTVATSVAVICVAAIGYEFLAGRVPVRRTVTILLGCFVLLGAPHIAAALSALAMREPSSALVGRESAVPLSVMSPRGSARSTPDPFDPYAGE